MTIFSVCCLPIADCDCSLLESLKTRITDEPLLDSLQVYTGGLATTCDTNATGPRVPYVVITDLGSNNSRRVGENVTQHQVTIPADVYATSESQGLALLRLIKAAWKTNTGSICTSDGYACLLPVQGRPVSAQLRGCVWRVRQTFAFLIHEPT